MEALIHDDIWSLIHKRYHLKSYRSDIKYDLMLNIILSMFGNNQHLMFILMRKCAKTLPNHTIMHTILIYSTIYKPSSCLLGGGQWWIYFEVTKHMARWFTCVYTPCLSILCMSHWTLSSFFVVAHIITATNVCGIAPHMGALAHTHGQKRICVCLKYIEAH
jgi:hypothetical protein